MDTVHHIIGSKPTKESSTRYGNVFNPATGDVIKRVVLGTQDDLNTAANLCRKHGISEATFYIWRLKTYG